jgi:hypothetical protein
MTAPNTPSDTPITAEQARAEGVVEGLRAGAASLLRIVKSANELETMHSFTLIGYENAAKHLKSLAAEQAKAEYICTCGLRVTPHRCQTGSDF